MSHYVAFIPQQCWTCAGCNSTERFILMHSSYYAVISIVTAYSQGHNGCST